MANIPDPFPFDFDPEDAASDRRAHVRAQDQAQIISALRDQLADARRELAFANRAVDEAQRSVLISRQLTTASLTETRDLCLPYVTKSLLYATVETLDLAREDGGLPDDYLRVRKRTIEQLEKFDSRGVFTTQEEGERQEAIRRSKVLIRFADIMQPRQLLDIEDAVLLLSSNDPSQPRIVVDGTLHTQTPGRHAGP